MYYVSLFIKPLCVFTCTSDVDVKDPDEKSIITYVAQFLQYSNDMPAPDDHLQVGNQTVTAELAAVLSVRSSPLGLKLK